MKESNAQTQVDVTVADLPLHCPMPSTSLWNSHPRVFIPVEESGEAKCPYCGTEFRLVKESSTEHASLSDAKT
ncbi:MAG: zinc-finger domain-containing protein [Gammaproteobacteria bacterium]|nr:zinc-finger domain-containing protein [Gammaproteobacteria bacterium]